MKAQKLNKRQVRWVLYLSRFDFTLKHILEIKIEKADELGRRPDQKVETENDNSNQILIKDHWIHNLVEIVIKGLEIDIVVKVLRGEE